MAGASPSPSPRKRVALLGCGAMGSQIAAAIDSGRVRASLVRVYDMDAARAESLASSLSSRPEVVQNAHLLSSGPGVDIVVEAASQEAVRASALSVLQNRKDLLIMSVGALLDEAVFDVLADACRQYGRTVVLPSGAVAGIDCLKAVRGELESVSLTTTKHPDSLRGAPFFERPGAPDPSSIAEATTIFDGTAAEAVALFPANVNVAAALALAGLGAASTRVRVVADPAAERNRHEIAASGAFGDLAVTVRNVPDPSNPKTSRLAVLSAIEALRAACEPGGVRRGT